MSYLHVKHVYFFYSDTNLFLFMQAWVFQHFQSIKATNHLDGH